MDLVRIASYCYAGAFGASFVIALFALSMSTGRSENKLWKSFSLLSFVNSIYCITGVLHNSADESNLYHFNVWNDIMGMILAPTFMTFVYIFLKKNKPIHITIGWVVALIWCGFLIGYPELVISKKLNFTQLPVQFYHYTNLYYAYLGTLFGMITLTLAILYVQGRQISEWNTIMKWIFPACILWGVSGMWDAYLSNLLKIAFPISWIGGLSVVLAFLSVVTAKSQKAFMIQEKHFLVMRDLEKARNIQNNLISNYFPAFGNIHISGKILPMDKMGGDYYEVNLLDSNHISVFISDVTGHGIASAFMTALLKIFKDEIPKKDLYNPSKVLDYINLKMKEKHFGILATGIYGVLEKRSRKFTYVSAGHPAILLSRNNATEVVELPGKGRLMGAFPELHLETNSITLEKGDRILLLTDGFQEAKNVRDEMYGQDRLKKFYHSIDFQVIDDLIGNIKNFIRDAEQSDDMAAILIKVN